MDGYATRLQCALCYNNNIAFCIVAKYYMILIKKCCFGNNLKHSHTTTTFTVLYVVMSFFSFIYSFFCYSFPDFPLPIIIWNLKMFENMKSNIHLITQYTIFKNQMIQQQKYGMKKDK